MNLIKSNAPPGSQKGQEILYDVLGSRVLENIASLSEERVLRGQPRPDRASTRRQFPQVWFYKGQPPSGRQAGHHHFWPELATVIEGNLDVAIGDQMYRATRGDWLVLKPEIVHGECCAQDRTAYRMVWFELDRPYPNMHVTAYKPAHGYTSFGVFGLPQLPAFLRASADKLFGPSLPSTGQVRMHLLRLVNWMMELLDQSLHPTLSKNSEKVLAVQELINNSKDTHPTVKELAAQAGLSANYLSTLFHSATGITIRQYIVNRQIEKAKVLLADPDCTIKEVAYQAGFQNQYHFSNAFRRATGIRPSAYQSSVKMGRSHEPHYPTASGTEEKPAEETAA